jgi:hypothetical protein
MPLSDAHAQHLRRALATLAAALGEPSVAAFAPTERGARLSAAASAQEQARDYFAGLPWGAISAPSPHAAPVPRSALADVERIDDVPAAPAQAVEHTAAYFRNLPWSEAAQPPAARPKFTVAAAPAPGAPSGPDAQDFFQSLPWGEVASAARRPVGLGGEIMLAATRSALRTAAQAFASASGELDETRQTCFAFFSAMPWDGPDASPPPAEARDASTRLKEP